LGTGILSPDAQDVTARGGGHPGAGGGPGGPGRGWVGWRMRHSWEGCCLSGLVVVGVCVGRRR